MNPLAAAATILAQDETDEPLSLYQRAENLACSPTGSAADSSGSPICRQIYELTESRLLATNFDALITSSVRVIFILVIAYLANRLLKRSIARFVKGLNDRGAEKLDAMARRGSVSHTAPINLKRQKMRTETIGGVLHSLTSFVIFTMAALMILGTFGFNLGPLIAGAGVAGVALGFGAQSLVKDFLSGLFMIMEDQFGVGDIVDVGEARGTVEATTLRTTRIRDISGTLWHVPNGEITRIGNMSQLWSRALLDIGVAYDTDLVKATEVLKATADAMSQEEAWRDFFFEEAEVWGVQALAADEITIRLVAKVIPAKQWAIERELRARIKHAFDVQDIEIPFPQRTLWIRQDAGGELADGGGGGANGTSAPAGADEGAGETSPWFGTQAGTPER